MAYVTGSDILALAGASDPTAEESAWAAKCAAAVESAIAYELVGVTIDPDTDPERAIIAAAHLDGAACYAKRSAPHGLVSLGEGETARLPADILSALRPVLDRYKPQGGFGGFA